MKREVIRKITASIVAFGAAAVLALSLAALVLSVVFSRPYFSLLTGDAYKTRVENEVMDKLEGYAIPGGLPQDFFETKLDKQLLRRDVKRAVDAAFAGETFTAEAFTSTVRENVMDYAAQNDIQVEAGVDTTEDNIEELVKLCTSGYRRIVNSEIIKLGGALSRQLSPTGWYVFFIAGVIALSLLLSVYKIGGKSYVRMSLGGAGLMLFLLPAYMLIFRNISKLGLTSPSMYSLATGMIYSLLGIMLALGILLLALANIPYNRKMKPSMEEKI